jgi:SAM domain (Sterile alpha motif)
MDLGKWLQGLGLERYEAAFRENEINERVLPSLTHETLKELGVTALGHSYTLTVPRAHKKRGAREMRKG